MSDIKDQMLKLLELDPMFQRALSLLETEEAKEKLREETLKFATNLFDPIVQMITDVKEDPQKLREVQERFQSEDQRVVTNEKDGNSDGGTT